MSIDKNELFVFLRARQAKFRINSVHCDSSDIISVEPSYIFNFALLFVRERGTFF